MVTMEKIQFDAILNTLAAQRNFALDEVATLRGELAAAKAEIQKLQQQLKGVSGE